MPRSFQIIIQATITLLLSILLIACSDSTDPAPGTGNYSETLGVGTVDPGANTFVLKTFDNPPPGGGPAVRIQLVGSNLIVDSGSGIVSIDVAIHNQHSEALYAPTVVWLSSFTPSQILVLNADLTMDPAGSDPDDPTGEMQYGFDYTELFGDEGILEPGATSEARTWRFSNHDGGSFSFAARADLGMVPDLPRIGGYCWHDGNRNGIPEPDENSLGFGFVNVRLPNGETAGVMLGPDGHYSLPVVEAGLYSLHFDPMIDTFAPLGFSTPNPLEVLLTQGPDGLPNSFLEANFGMFNDVPFGPVIQFTDQAPDSLQVGSYQLIDARLESPFSLLVHVHFSGCGPDETFSLFMTGDFMESSPPQASIVLRKDWESDCDAIWDKEIRFDLGPLVHRFLEGYGPGSLLLNIHDYNGDMRQMELAIFPPD